MCQKLGGRLPQNTCETTSLKAQFTAKNTSYELIFNWTQCFEELCDLTVDNEGPWDKDGWYCVPCVDVLITSRLRIWWLAKKREREL